MPLSVATVEQEAYGLPLEQRERLAHKLFESVHHSDLNEIDRAWLSVAKDRFSDLKSGKDKGLTESEFFQKVRSQI